MVRRIEDNLEWTYELTIEPHSTNRLMHLTALANTRAEAIAVAQALVADSGLSAEARIFLTEEELTSLANFQFLPSTVTGRYVFYNQSKFDGNDAAANANDDNAIATDKIALLPGQSSSFANYTNYNRGLNGIMIDIAGLPPGAGLSASDCEFKVGNSNTPSEWAALTAAPTVLIRQGAGVGGSSRVTLIWPAGAAIKQWLQVTVKANSNTGLGTPDVFYFGNAVGESGNVTGDYSVSLSDELLARNNPVSIIPGALVTNRFDFNRDGTVSVIDQLLSRNNITTAATKLKQITPAASVQVPRLLAQPLYAQATSAVNFAVIAATANRTQAPLKAGHIAEISTASSAVADEALPRRRALAASKLSDELLELLAQRR